MNYMVFFKRKKQTNISYRFNCSITHLSKDAVTRIKDTVVKKFFAKKSQKPVKSSVKQCETLVTKQNVFLLFYSQTFVKQSDK